MKSRLFIALLSVCGMGNLVAQTTIDTIYFATSGSDAYTNSGSTGTNYGTDTSLWVYYDYGSPSKTYNSYLKTDYSSVPSGAIVLNATLKMYALSVNNDADHATYINRVTSSWDEGTIKWSVAPSTTNTYQVTVPDDDCDNVGWQSFDVSLITQHQVEFPSENHGIRLYPVANSGTTDKGVKYASTEHSNSNIRPYIIVEYYLPESDTIYFSTNRDSRVYSGSTGTNYGTDTTLSVFWDASSKANRSFLYADLSGIGTDKLVSKTSLNMYAYSVDNTANHPMYIEGVNSASWTEGGITWANQPTVVSTNRVSVTHAQTSSTGWHQFSISALVQTAICSPEKNYGWRMALQSESGSSVNGVKYNSAESVDTTKRPYLFVEYVDPVEIEGYVTHCTEGNNDGIISGIQVSGGCGLYKSYSWRKYSSGGSYVGVESGTFINDAGISSLSDGLYQIIVTDWRGVVGHKFFLVGEENVTTSVEITGSASSMSGYIEDSYVVYNKTTGDSTTTGGNATTVGCYSNTANNSKSYISYQVDWDPSLEFTSCRQALRDKGGCFQNATSDNDAWVSRVTEPWGEQYVTWATRPDVTTQDRVYIPTTTTNGLERRPDTISILGFVPYWQEHPEENYGFELALCTYDQAAAASRDYSSADYIGHNLMISFTPKPRIETEFVDSTGKGSILVNAPAAELPFTYLIGYSELPSLNSIWQEIKDSISVDSLTFFRGKSATRNYTFADLEAEHYFVAVYDNTGSRIYDSEILLTSPTTLLSSFHLDNDTIKTGSGYSSGYGTLDARLDSKQDGAFEFEVTQLGDIIIGLNYVSDAGARLAADFEYAIELDATAKHFKVEASGTVLFEDTLVINDIFRFEKENYQFVVYRNEYEMYRHAMSRLPSDDFKVDAVFKTAVGIMAKPVKIGKIKTPKPIGYTITHAECDGPNGSIKMKFNSMQFSGVTGGSFVIKNASSGTTIESGTFTYPNPITEYLPAGDYKVTFTTTGSPATSWTEYFTIGQPVIWDFPNPYYTPVGANLITSNSSTYTAIATSQNILLEEQTEGFVTFKLGVKHYYVPWGTSPTSPIPVHSSVSFIESDDDQVIKLRGFSLGASVISQYVEVYNGSNTLINTPFLINTEGPFKIKLYDDTLKTYYNNSTTSFAYVPQGAADDYRVKATSFYGYVKDAQVDFCYGSTSSETCAELDYELNGNYYVTNNGYFCFVFNQEYNDTTLTFNIYNISNAVVATQADFDLNDMIYGENRVVLDFTGSGHCLGKGYFVLEVINSKNEKFYLRFYNNYLGCLPTFGSVSGLLPSFE